MLQKGMRQRKAVASFTDAWIETIKNNNFETVSDVASFTDAWIETPVTSL